MLNGGWTLYKELSIRSDEERGWSRHRMRSTLIVYYQFFYPQKSRSWKASMAMFFVIDK